MTILLRNLSRWAPALALLLAVPVGAYSSEPGASLPAAAVLAGAASVAAGESSAFLATSDAAVAAMAGLEFRNIGPAIMGGRIASLAVFADNPSIFYVGAASGGVWKTTNYGTTFEPLFDDQPTASIGDVAVSQQNHNLVWVGTGEPNNRQSSPWGNGVYKTLDGGITWQYMGLYDTRHVGRIKIDPTNNNTVFVAAVGHLWGPNEERGVFRTRDGGETWEKVLYIDEDTGVIDLAMDPNDPQTVFAAAYQRRRTAGGFNGGGPGSGIYRTMDGGDTWEELTNGLPQRDMGRIGVDIYRRDGNLVFATVEAGAGRGGVYRSTDRGTTWEHISTQNNRPMYYSQIRVDPSDPDRVYSAGSNFFASEDGGRTFDGTAGAGVHLDHHAIWIDPNNSNNMMIAGDGGISQTFDRGASWRQLRNIVVSQFYEIGVDMREPYYVCGGLQDNGSWCGPSSTNSTLGIRNRDWYNVGSGDGFYVRIDPTDSSVVYAESQGGNLTRVDLKTGERQRIRPLPRAQGKGPESSEDVSYNFNWNSPMLISEHGNEILYFGSSHLLKSTDRGLSWEAISPNLTTGVDRDELEIMGSLVRRGETLSANDGISNYGNFKTVSESPVTPGVLYAGTDDGNIQGTRDSGANWALLSGDMPGLAAGNTVVSRVVASRFAEGRVYATFDGHERDDYRPYVYRSDNYGESWEPIVTGLPEDWSVNVIVEHPRNENLLFLGNEVGVFVSVDRGATWAQLKAGLPTVPVDDIVIHPRDNDLVLGTHGRGIWILDDITPLEEWSDLVAASAAHLFTPRRSTIYSKYAPQGWSPGIWSAANPPQGAIIRYFLREDAPIGRPEAGQGAGQGGGGRGGGQFAAFGGRGGGNQAPPPPPPVSPEPTVKLMILDANGDFVRDFEGPGKAGVNQAVWNFRIQDAYVPDPDAPPTGGGGRRGRRGGGGRQGPRVLPGRYTVRLEAGGRTIDATFDVALDPRADISRADLEARQEALTDAYNLVEPLYRAQVAIRRIDRQLTEIRGMAGDEAPQELRDQLAEVRRMAREATEALEKVQQGAGASGAIQSFTGPPTADQLWQIDRAWEAIPGVAEQINALMPRLPVLYGFVYQPGFIPEALEPLPIPQRPGR